MIDFPVGQVLKRAQIHERLGGQQQGGISTPARFPVVILFTGEQGTQYGYDDGYRNGDDLYWYTGEGQVGDMTWVRGNRAIRDHQRLGKELHVFEYLRGSEVQYLGPASYVVHEIQDRPDKTKNIRKAIVFGLTLPPLSTGTSGVIPRDPDPKATRLSKRPIDELKIAALLASSFNNQSSLNSRISYSRSAAIKAYVLARANGICEGCEQPAPFVGVKGSPYLEPHHTRRLADAGPDHPRWVIALCPNCHARVHRSADGQSYNDYLSEKLRVMEPDE
jgi:5-methylcytosine-specific restriction protein A